MSQVALRPGIQMFTKKKVALRVRLLLLGLLPLVFTGTRPDGCSSGERSALVKRTRQNVKLPVRSTLR